MDDATEADDYATALEVAAEYQAIDPADADVAETLDDLQDFARARDFVDGYIEFNTFLEARNFSSALARSVELEAAAAELEDPTQFSFEVTSPDGTLVSRTVGDLLGELRDARHRIRSLSGKTDQLMATAEDLVAEERWEAAKQILDRALADDPGHESCLAAQERISTLIVSERQGIEQLVVDVARLEEMLQARELHDCRRLVDELRERNVPAPRSQSGFTEDWEGALADLAELEDCLVGREKQLGGYLENARRALARKDYQASRKACLAARGLSIDDTGVAELLRRIDEALGKARRWVGRAEKALAVGDFAGARDACDRALALEAGNVDADRLLVRIEMAAQSRQRSRRIIVVSALAAGTGVGVFVWCAVAGASMVYGAAFLLAAAVIGAAIWYGVRLRLQEEDVVLVEGGEAAATAPEAPEPAAQAPAAPEPVAPPPPRSAYERNPMLQLSTLIEAFESGLTYDGASSPALAEAEKELLEFKENGGSFWGARSWMEEPEYYRDLSSATLADECFSRPIVAQDMEVHDDPQLVFKRLEIMHNGFAELFRRRDMFVGIQLVYGKLAERIAPDAPAGQIRRAAAALKSLREFYKFPVFRTQAHGHEQDFLDLNLQVLRSFLACLEALPEGVSGDELPFFDEPFAVAQVAMMLARHIDIEQFTRIAPEILAARCADGDPGELAAFLQLVLARLETA